MYQSDNESVAEERRRKEEQRLLVGSDHQQPNYEYPPVQYDELAKDYPAESPLKDEHYLYTGWNGIYQGTFAGFIWMARFLNSKVKYYMASASIPVEIINFLIVLKKVVGREKPWTIFVGIVLPLLALIGTMVLVDLVRFGIITSGPLAAIAGAGPFIFTGALAIFGTLNLLRTIDTAKACWAAYQNGTLTYLHKVRLASRITKTAALFALSGLIAPFMLATVANPFGAILFGAAITAVLATVVVMKIWKTVQENREWRNTLQELHSNGEDPYEVLGVDHTHLQELIDAKNLNSGVTKLKNMFGRVKYTLINLFGSDAQKAAVTKQESPTSYIDGLLATKMNEPGADKAKLARYAELIRKQRGRDMHKEYLVRKIIHDLKGQDPYAFLGTTAEAVEAEVAQEEKPGFFTKLFKGAPESEKIKTHLQEKYDAFVLGSNNEQDKKLAKRVLKMLSKAKGREKYKEYIATQDKKSVPKYATPIREVENATKRSGSGESLLGWTYGNSSSSGSHANATLVAESQGRMPSFQ